MKKTVYSILFVALISVFLFAGTIMTVKASPKAEFLIVYNLTSHARQTRVDNERVWQYKMSQTGSISNSSILLDEGILGGQVYFNWLIVHNKQSDVARALGRFEIISSGNVVLLAGTVMAEVKDFSTGTPLVEVIYLGHGYVNIWGITEDIGFLIPIDVDGYYW